MSELMNDDMDAHLSRSIKNWAAQAQPPKEGRQRLLAAATSPPPQIKQYFLGSTPTSYFYHQDYQRRSEAHTSLWIGPFQHSPMWSFYNVIDWRVAV